MGNIRGGMNGFLGTIGQPTAQVIDSSLKFKGGQYLERTSTAGNQTTWTWSGWIKVSDLSGNNIFGEDGGYPNASASFNTSGVLRFTAAGADTSVFLNVIPSAQFRDFSAWYHFVIVYDSGNAISSERARIYVNGKRLRELSTATYPSQNVTTVVNSNGNAFRIGSHSGVDHLQGYQSNAYLIDGQAIAPGFFGFTDPLTGTWRPKRLRDGDPTASDGRTFSGASISGGGSLSNLFDGNASTSATQSSVGTSVKITGFGPVRVASHVSFYSPDGPAFYTLNGGKEHRFYSAGWHEIEFSGSLREFTWIGNGARIFIYAMKVDGVELVDATTTNINFGVNGFYLPMDDEDRFRLDQSGKNNHFSEAGWSGTSIDPDVVKDSPSGAVFGGRGQTGITTTSSAPTNYCTWNPLWSVTNSAGSNSTFTNASLTGTTSNSATSGGLGSIGVSSGKWYFEITCGAFTGGTGLEVGVAKENLQSTISSSEGGGTSADGYFYINDGRKVNNNSASSYGASYTDGDVISVFLDLDAGSISFHKNGADQGTAYTGLSGVYYPAFSDYNNSGTSACTLNCGQKPFKYAPPQGYLPINSANVRPNKVITRPDQYVGVATYTGSGNSSQDIIFGFKPDFGWTKSRSTAENHGLFDSVRGLPKFLRSDTNAAEYTLASGTPVSFISNGINFTNGSGEINESDRRYVAWAWKAGGDKNTFNIDDIGYASAAAAGLDGGSINPTGASVGTEQGFSITTITTPSSAGAYTVSHGLTKAPDFIIYRIYDQSMSWYVWHQGYGAANKYMLLNAASAVSSGTYVFNNTLPTASVITDYADNSNHHNEGRAMIYYSWHDVPGLQKFGTFTGNGNAEGPFVELGFRPSIVWIRRTDSGQNWAVHDAARNKFNECDKNLAFNLSSVENNSGDIGTADANEMDFLSNGFKLRDSAAVQNASGGTYIYCAWAEAPASNLFGGQSNAR